MLDQASIISICSAGAVIIATLKINSNTIQNLKDSLSEFKCDIKEEIGKEKRHAMELASQRIGNIEKDVDEIFPRLRTAEDNVKKNCFVVSSMQKNCIRHQEEKP